MLKKVHFIFSILIMMIFTVLIIIGFILGVGFFPKTGDEPNPYAGMFIVISILMFMTALWFLITVIKDGIRYFLKKTNMRQMPIICLITGFIAPFYIIAIEDSKTAKISFIDISIYFTVVLLVLFFVLDFIYKRQKLKKP